LQRVGARRDQAALLALVFAGFVVALFGTMGIAPHHAAETRAARVYGIGAAISAIGAMLIAIRAADPRLRLLPAVAALALLLAAPARAQGDPASGRSLFVAGCAECHGLDARGIPGSGPSLRGVGARAADFFLRTGRMPLADPHDEPLRTEPEYPESQIEDLVAYVGSLGGPPIPEVHPERGNLGEGFRLFADHCAGCHQIVAKGGIVPGAMAPPLQDVTQTQIAEAVRVGPYVMPHFDEHLIDRQELDSLVRYVLSTREPDNRGGWGIGNLGPIPEGLVTWWIAAPLLIVACMALGRRLRG
jgi:ubiquinol-cytochrome c reductase cytochrome c subunit